VLLRLSMRRFFCDNVGCSRRTFLEQPKDLTNVMPVGRALLLGVAAESRIALVRSSGRLLCWSWGSFVRDKFRTSPAAPGLR
jgi:hypothetical protein